jgi:hypothetical protein
VTRDSLHAALKANAPDSATRIGNRRVFTEEEVARLAAWFERRRKIRDGLLRPWETENDSDQNIRKDVRREYHYDKRT